MGDEAATVVGIVLAAGAGVRAGGPKALRMDAAGRPWLVIALDLMGSVSSVTPIVVLGAAADDARSLIGNDAAEVVVAEDWAHGLSASVRAGLDAAAATSATAAVITLVDLPGLPASVVTRLMEAGPIDAAVLRRAVVGGVPRHPVLIGRDHWTGAAASAHGDRGAGPYLRAHDAVLVECGDLWDGLDEDGPAEPRG